MNVDELDKLKGFNRQNRTWLLGVWLYAIVWLIIFLTGFFITPSYFVQDNVFIPGVEPITEPFPTYLIWHGAVAGGFGGVMNMFYSLIEVVMRGNRDREYLSVIYYLAQPFIGIIFGIVAVLLIVTIGQLFSESIQQVTDIFLLVTFSSFMIGYLQRAILRTLKRLGYGLRPKTYEA